MVIVRCVAATLFRSFDKFGRMEPWPRFRSLVIFQHTILPTHMTLVFVARKSEGVWRSVIHENPYRVHLLVIPKYPHIPYLQVSGNPPI